VLSEARSELAAVSLSLYETVVASLDLVRDLAELSHCLSACHDQLANLVEVFPMQLRSIKI
jgi:hypothetical protein